MKCQEGMELMQRYVDYDLNDEETARLMEHVGQCPDCAAMFQRLVRLSRGLEQLPRVSPPYSLVDAILPKLEYLQPEPGAEVSAAHSAGAGASGRMKSRRQAGRKHYRSWITSVAAVAALGAVIGLFFLNRPETGTPLFSRQAATLNESAGSAGQAAERSSADAMLFAAPTIGVSDGNEAAQPGSSPDGPVRGFGGISQDPKQAVQERPNVKEWLNAEDQSGSAPPAPAPDQRESAPGSSPVSSPAPEKRDEGPAAKNPPAEELPAGEIGTGETMSAMIFPDTTEEAVSPDGQWKAVIANGALQLYRMRDNVLVYDQAPDPCVRSGLAWSEDGSEVRYVCTDADGNETPMALRIEEQTFTEIRRR